MAGGYVMGEEHFTEDFEQVTAPQELSLDSVCGAASLPVAPAPAPTSTKEK